MMKLHLSKLLTKDVTGIYKIGGEPARLPERMLYLNPSAALSFGEISNALVVSDMLRTAESSLAAVKAARGAQPPGYSGHNFGLSIDLDVKATMVKIKTKSKVELDEWMESSGWFCHRRDHKMDSESWHFNYLGVGTKISPKVKTTSGYIEADIVKRYGSAWQNMDRFELQRCLASLKFYSGDIDGRIGPISRSAIAAFQRAWNLPDAGTEDAKTKRTLAFVSAERFIV